MKVSERSITVAMIRQALNLVTYRRETTVEEMEPPCEWPKLCSETACTYPRYSRDGDPWGLTGRVLFQLGYPLEVLKELDREHEVGEVLHPGVKIARSRNAALARIDYRGVQLLGFLQAGQKSGYSWGDLAVRAFRPRRTLKLLDRRRRPWLYEI